MRHHGADTNTAYPAGAYAYVRAANQSGIYSCHDSHQRQRLYIPHRER
jgi:hypothetical protein